MRKTAWDRDAEWRTARTLSVWTSSASSTWQDVVIRVKELQPSHSAVPVIGDLTATVIVFFHFALLNHLELFLRYFEHCVHSKCIISYWAEKIFVSCAECPGGAEVPCSGHGQCYDSFSGNGSCTCVVGYHAHIFYICEWCYKFVPFVILSVNMIFRKLWTNVHEMWKELGLESRRKSIRFWDHI